MDERSKFVIYLPIKNRLPKHLVLPVACMLLGLLTVPCAQAGPAASYDVLKTAIWNITNPADPAGGALDAKGTYRYMTHAFSGDKHGTQHNDSPQTGAIFGPLAQNLVPSGGSSDARVRDSVHNWTSAAQFNQLGGNQQFGPFESVAQSLHPKSSSRVNISYDQQALPTFPPNTAGAAIRLTGRAEIQNLPLHPPETAYAEAKSAAEIDVKGRLLKVEVIGGKAALPNIKVVQGLTTLRAVGSARAVQIDNPPGTAGLAGSSGYYGDPFSLSIYDEKTGDLIVKNNIFNEKWMAQGNAGITYDPMVGLTLTADNNSYVDLSIETVSSWVLNPFNGSATVKDGVFRADGNLGLLPWVVSLNSSGDLQASVDIANLLDFNLMVEADGLGIPENDLIVELTNQADGMADAYVSVPEPSIFSLVGFGILAFGFSSRRFGKHFLNVVA